MDLQALLQNNPIIGLVLYIAFFAAIFWFILIRPQRKKDKEYKELLASMAIGDEVVTIGGFYGKITRIKDDKIEFETGTNEKVTLSVYKWGVKEIKKTETA